MGRVIDSRTIYKGFELTDTEKRMAKWVETKDDDVTLVFSVVWPEEGSDDEAFTTVDLTVERRVGEKIYAWVTFLGNASGPYPEIWDHWEKLTRAGLERLVEESTVEGHAIPADYADSAE